MSTIVKGISGNGEIQCFYNHEESEVNCPLEQLLSDDRHRALNEIELFTSNDTRCMCDTHICPFLERVDFGWANHEGELMTVNINIHCSIEVDGDTEHDMGQIIQIIVWFIEKHK